MEVPPEISFRNVEPTQEIKAKIHDEIDKLDRLYPRVIACRVMVDVPHKRHETGNLYHVRIDLTIPKQELVVSRDPPEQQSRESLSAAISDAFTDMQRQLKEHVARMRGD